MRSVITCLLCLIAHVSLSVPSWGIAVNNDGNVYFLDVLSNNGTLWKVDNRGKLYEIFSDFHAHDMEIDKNGNLWIAENLWLDGVLDGEGSHTLIKVSPEEKIDTLINTSDADHFNGSDIAIGPDHSVYFINKNRIYKYGKDKSTLVLSHQFKNVKNMAFDTNGILWIADNGVANGTLYQLSTKGKLTKYVDNLMPEDPAYPLLKNKNKQFIAGISTDGQGAIYISENAGCRIIKIDPNGEKTIFYESPALWAPMNVYFYRGDAYILEIGYNKKYKGPRIIKRNKSGSIQRLVNIQNIPEREIINAQNNSFLIPPWVYFGLGLLTFALVIILAVRKQLSGES